MLRAAANRGATVITLMHVQDTELAEHAAMIKVNRDGLADVWMHGTVHIKAQACQRVVGQHALATHPSAGVSTPLDGLSATVS